MHVYKLNYVLGFLLGLVSLVAHSQTQLGDLKIMHPSVRATAAGQMLSSAYVTIENKSKQPDRLISASSTRAKEIQIHMMRMDGDKMMMRQIPSLEIPANTVVELKSGGYHLMLMDLNNGIAEGEKVLISLQFEKAGKVDVVFPGNMRAGMKKH